MIGSLQDLINTVDTAKEKLVKSARHAPIREKTIDTLCEQQNTKNKLVKQESTLQRHIRAVVLYEELMAQMKKSLQETQEKMNDIGSDPLVEEPAKMNEKFLEIEVFHCVIINIKPYFAIVCFIITDERISRVLLHVSLSLSGPYQ